MIDMFTKILIIGLLAAATIASPVGPAEEEEDLPVYTEKVLPGKPTQAPKFGAKKVSLSPRKATEKLPVENRKQYESPVQTTFVPKPILKSTKPLRGSNRPVRRINRIPSTPPAGYNEIKPIAHNDYDEPSPSLIATQGLGVEYAPEVEVPSAHDDLVDDYAPRKIHSSNAPRSIRNHPRAEPVDNHPRAEPVAYHPRAEPVDNHPRAEPVAYHPRAEPVDNHPRAEPVAYHPRAEPVATHPQENSQPRRVLHHASSDIGSAVGNAPQLRYAAAPQKFASSPAQVKDIPDYSYTGNSYEDKPQPYIFGYELHDETGSTQSRKEQGDDYGNKRGSYGYTDGHGIYRQVDYIADEHGFRAIVKTNEPGTDNQNPADVEMQSEAQKY